MCERPGFAQNATVWYRDSACGFVKGKILDILEKRILIAVDRQQNALFDSSRRVQLDRESINTISVSASDVFLDSDLRDDSMWPLSCTSLVSQESAEFIAVMGIAKRVNGPVSCIPLLQDFLVVVVDQDLTSTEIGPGDESCFHSLMSHSMAELDNPETKTTCVLINGVSNHRTKVFKEFVKIMGTKSCNEKRCVTFIRSLESVVEYLSSALSARGVPKVCCSQILQLNDCELKYELYMLDIGRVTTIGFGEKSFAVFYYISDGLASLMQSLAEEGSSLTGSSQIIWTILWNMFIKQPSRYNSPRHVGCYSEPLDSAFASAHLKNFFKGLEMLGMVHEEIIQVLGLLVTITILSNLSTHGKISSSGPPAILSRIVPVLWGCPPTCLEPFAPHDQEMNHEQVARLNLLLRCLAVKLYEMLVQVIVQRVNANSAGKLPGKTLYLCDTPGFDLSPGDTITFLIWNCANEILMREIAGRWEVQYDSMGNLDPPICTDLQTNELTSPYVSSSLFQRLALFAEETGPQDLYENGDVKLRTSLQNWATKESSRNFRFSSKLFIIKHHVKEISYTTERWAIQTVALDVTTFWSIMKDSTLSVVKEMLQRIPMKSRKKIKEKNFQGHTNRYADELDRFLKLLDNKIIKFVAVVERPCKSERNNFRYLQYASKIYGFANALVSTADKACYRITQSEIFDWLNLPKMMQLSEPLRRRAILIVMNQYSMSLGVHYNVQHHSIWVNSRGAVDLYEYSHIPKNRLILHQLLAAWRAGCKLRHTVLALQFLRRLGKLSKLAVEERNYKRARALQDRIEHVAMHLQPYLNENSTMFKHFEAFTMLLRKPLSQVLNEWSKLSKDHLRSARNDRQFSSQECLEFSTSGTTTLYDSCRQGQVTIKMRSFTRNPSSRHDLVLMKVGTEMWVLFVEMKADAIVDNGQTINYFEPDLVRLQQMQWILIRYEFSVDSEVKTRPLVIRLVILDPFLADKFYLIDENGLVFTCTWAFSTGRKALQRYIGKLVRERLSSLVDGVCLPVAYEDHKCLIMLIWVSNDLPFHCWELVEIDSGRDSRNVCSLQYVKMGTTINLAIHLVAQANCVVHCQYKESRDISTSTHTFVSFVPEKRICVPIPPCMVEEITPCVLEKLSVEDVQALDENRAVALTANGELILITVSSVHRHSMDDVFYPHISVKRTFSSSAIPPTVRYCAWDKLLIDRRQVQPRMLLCNADGNIISVDTVTWTVVDGFVVGSKGTGKECVVGYSQMISAPHCLVFLSTLTGTMLVMDLDLETLIFAKCLPRDLQHCNLLR